MVRQIESMIGATSTDPDDASTPRSLSGADFLAVAPYNARHSTSSQSWFRTPVTPTIAHEVEASAESAAATKVDAARENFAHLSHDIQGNMDQLMLQSSATQQEATERVQSSLALITGLVLVPTFVAGMFGANTRLPGGGSWFGFDLMIGLMVASGVATFWYLRRIGRR